MTPEEIKSALSSLDKMDRALLQKEAEIAAGRKGIPALKAAVLSLGLDVASEPEIPPPVKAAEPEQPESPVVATSPSLQQAVEAAVIEIDSKEHKGATCLEVTENLKRAGFKSTAKDLYSSVSVTLMRLSKPNRGALTKDTSGGKSKYFPASTLPNLHAVNGTGKEAAA